MNHYTFLYSLRHYESIAVGVCDVRARRLVRPRISSGQLVRGGFARVPGVLIKRKPQSAFVSWCVHKFFCVWLLKIGTGRNKSILLYRRQLVLYSANSLRSESFNTSGRAFASRSFLMGCALSTSEKEATQRSLAIDRTLASDNALKRNEIKLLLLGEWTQLVRRVDHSSWYVTTYPVYIRRSQGR